jgi:hypothetical protein
MYKMGFGFQESVYENCTAIELAERGLSFEAQKPIQVHDDGHPVGLLLNFGEKGVQVKRKLRVLKG